MESTNNTLFPNPARELRKLRSVLAREKEINDKIHTEELVLLEETDQNGDNCTCDSYFLKTAVWPKPPCPAQKLSIQNHARIKSATRQKKVHSPMCHAVLKQKPGSSSCTSQNSSSGSSILSMTHSADSSFSFNSDDEYGDLSEFFDPLKCHNGSFSIYKINLSLSHPVGNHAKYNSIVEFLTQASDFPPGRVSELCVNPGSGKIIHVEQSVIDSFYKLAWSFINDTQAEDLILRIHRREITPYDLVCHYGRHVSFKPSLVTATWDQFQRIFPDWSFPAISSSGGGGVNNLATHKWYYTTHPNYGLGRVYPHFVSYPCTTRKLKK